MTPDQMPKRSDELEASVERWCARSSEAQDKRSYWINECSKLCDKIEILQKKHAADQMVIDLSLHACNLLITAVDGKHDLRDLSEDQLQIYRAAKDALAERDKAYQAVENDR